MISNPYPLYADIMLKFYSKTELSGDPNLKRMCKGCEMYEGKRHDYTKCANCARFERHGEKMMAYISYERHEWQEQGGKY